jgi:hypothetical protein
MSLYAVTGPTSYRDHRPGQTFEASLDQQTEERAIRRGAITLLERSRPQLTEGSWSLPRHERGRNA